MKKSRCLWGMLLLVGCLLRPAWAGDQFWEFVDGAGVVHMGNVAPPAKREVIWLNQVIPSSAKADRNQGRGTSAARFPGYDVAKPHLEAAALAQSLDPALVVAVAAAESAFNVNAVSSKGALGLMQVLPSTAERYGVATMASVEDFRTAVMEPQVNAQIGSRYLADLLRMFDGDKELALAAYNAGEGAVLKHGRRIPPYPETRQYVDRVMRFYHSLTQ